MTYTTLKYIHTYATTLIKRGSYFFFKLKRGSYIG